MADGRVPLTLWLSVSVVRLLTCPPEHGVIEERELHLGVMLQRGPASRRRDIDVGHVEWNLHRQERLS